ncbi:MAG: hypothetical protein QM617_01970 [Comamonas sp.]
MENKPYLMGFIFGMVMLKRLLVLLAIVSGAVAHAATCSVTRVTVTKTGTVAAASTAIVYEKTLHCTGHGGFVAALSASSNTRYLTLRLQKYVKGAWQTVKAGRKVTYARPAVGVYRLVVHSAYATGPQFARPHSWSVTYTNPG